jgi:predicted dehydrogenase
MSVDINRPVTSVLIGAGNRGRGIFGQYALDCPHRATFVAVVEPEPSRRTAFAVAHGIPPSMQFATPAEFFTRHPQKMAEAMIIASLEDVRAEPVRASLKAGYAVLCEKPLALTPADTKAVTDAAKDYPGLFMVCHQMRYTPLYYTLRQRVASGRYGQVVHVEHSENLHFEHMAHGFVRGVFNNDQLSPMILAKSCHDMDLLLYLVNAKPLRVASFGSLTHFRPENTPEGATAFCLDGCPAAGSCPYDVMRLYFRPNTDPALIRQMGVVHDRQHLFELLKTNRYGRCVYRCDNNVVDHQVCAFEFAGGITAAFTMCGYNGVDRRRTRISLTDGEMELDTSKAAIEIRRFSTGEHEWVTPPIIGTTHSGGDRGIMDSFVDAVRTGCHDDVLTSVSDSLDSHLMAFAAEASRKIGRIIDLNEYEKVAGAELSKGTGA